MLNCKNFNLFSFSPIDIFAGLSTSTNVSLDTSNNGSVIKVGLFPVMSYIGTVIGFPSSSDVLFTCSVVNMIEPGKFNTISLIEALIRSIADP